MADTVLPSESRDTTESKSSKFLLESVRFEDMSDRKNSFLVIIIGVRLVVLSVEGVSIERLSIRSSEINGTRHIDKPARPEVVSEGRLLDIRELVEVKNPDFRSFITFERDAFRRLFFESFQSGCEGAVGGVCT